MPGMRGGTERPYLNGPGSQVQGEDGSTLVGPPVIEYGSTGSIFIRESAPLHQTMHAGLGLILGLIGAQVAFAMWTPDDRERESSL